MDTRREFLKKLTMLTGAAGIAGLPPSIQKALAIMPDVGSTFLDAEHIVILMQENRSFDHAFGTLRGVRGFNDPRAIRLPNNNLVWLQTNDKGETYSPFRLDIKDTKITWMGSLPHGRESQVSARNNGRYDNWIEAKKSGDKEYADMPLTMGYYTRKDIPFYYALADAFTICDQHFCSSLTGTDPNRLHFWSGTIRAEHDENSRAFTENGDVENGVNWRTFPELLEENNISWKVYQNEVSVDVGFTEEQDQWLGNFGDNVLEYFDQFNVKYLQSYINFLPQKIDSLKADIEKFQSQLSGLTPNSDEYKKTEQKLKNSQNDLSIAIEDQKKYTAKNFNDLSNHKKNIHQKAFITNTDDPDQRKLTPLNYIDETINREINIPKGDVLYQFREDVKSGNLPTVAWLVAPENFSDHPSAPWFGSWYLSETMDILTHNPEVWKKTIFILTYDENDGYFDHISPFIAPEYNHPETGSVSNNLDTRLDYVKDEKDVTGPIGLGFRVPMIIASPWSRGGYVNSEVFDHTSVIKFVETFINKKFGKNIRETNITPWRRLVTGDLTSTFRKFEGVSSNELPFLKKDPFIESIHKASFKNVPSNYKALSQNEIDELNKNPNNSQYMPQQEKGICNACALPYELYVDGSLTADKNSYLISMWVGDILFNERSANSPFTVYAYTKELMIKNYMVVAGGQLFDETSLNKFDDNNYKIEVNGPNGFFRSFKGNKNDSPLLINFRYDDANWNVVGKAPDFTGKIVMSFINPDLHNKYTIRIVDNSYKSFKPIIKDIPKVNESHATNIIVDPTSNFCWYDFSVFVEGNDVFEKRYAGHVETGKESKSDPLMGMMI